MAYWYATRSSNVSVPAEAFSPAWVSGSAHGVTVSTANATLDQRKKRVTARLRRSARCELFGSPFIAFIPQATFPPNHIQLLIAVVHAIKINMNMTSRIIVSELGHPAPLTGRIRD